VRLVDPSWDEARAAAHASGVALSTQSLALDDALWRTTATAVVARTPLPPWDASAMDGWAVAGAGPWTVVGDQRAGMAPAGPLAAGQAVRIATGAVLPAGSSAVLRREDATVDSAGQVHGVPRAGGDIRHAGEECPASTTLVAAGQVLGPVRLGLAAAGGNDMVDVVRRPRAVVLVLGDELLRDGVPRDGRVRDSLGPLLPGWLTGWGCEVVGVRQVADRADEHAASISSALTDADLVVTTGGTANGPADFVHRAVAETGGDLVVDGVHCRPGHPMLLARWTRDDGRRWLVGLPGNPHAAIAALMTLAQPLLLAMHGTDLPALARVPVAARIGPRGTGTRLVPCRIVDGAAHPGEHIGSGMLRGLAAADGLAVAAGEVAAGELVRWLPLPR
jgi:molybdopterin molybdotransferase